MDDKNIVLQNYAGALMNATNTLMMCINGLGENETVNNGIIKTAYVCVATVNSSLTLLQNALDEYNKGA